MSKDVVIIESPNKIPKFRAAMGKDISNFEVLSSYGHMFQLASKNKGIDVENNFRANLELAPDKYAVAKRIVEACKKAKKIYLATDPDREGEGIANDILVYLRKKGIKAEAFRVTFNEVTPTAVQHAMKNPGKLDMNLVNAQTTRRAVDYLIGYNISPLLWRIAGNHASAGRVQSPVLNLMCERHNEIVNFVPTPYHEFNIDVNLDGNIINAKFFKYKDIKAERLEKDTPLFKAINGDVSAFEKEMRKVDVVKVVEIKEKPSKRQPGAPFTTSAMQQAAHSRYGFPPDKTMRIAQHLFETGFITYHRTDSVRISDEFMYPMRNEIKKRFGDKYLSPSVRFFKTKTKNAQEGHECIRPSYLEKTPETINLPPDEKKIYTLIYNRTMASQMEAMEQITTTAILEKGDFGFKVSGTVTVFDGYSRLYGFDERDRSLPPFKLDSTYKVNAHHREDKQTEPPPRYNESSVVRKMEETGIGRPSTYASTIKTLRDRQYVERDGNALVVTSKGLFVNNFLSSKLSTYVDTDFTAQMEDLLDGIASGKVDHLGTLSTYWENLKGAVQPLKGSKDYSSNILDTLEEDCPECKQFKLVKRIGQYGQYISCGNYPACKYVKKQTYKIAEGINCPKCGSTAYDKLSKKNKQYYQCTDSKCDNVFFPSSPELLPESERVSCPICKQGFLVGKKSKYGMFYGCSRYPDCRAFVSQKDYEILKTGGEVEVRELKPKPQNTKNFKPKGKPKGKFQKGKK